MMNAVDEPMEVDCQSGIGVFEPSVLIGGQATQSLMDSSSCPISLKRTLDCESVAKSDLVEESMNGSGEIASNLSLLHQEACEKREATCSSGSMTDDNIASESCHGEGSGKKTEEDAPHVIIDSNCEANQTVKALILTAEEVIVDIINEILDNVWSGNVRNGRESEKVTVEEKTNDMEDTEHCSSDSALETDVNIKVDFKRDVSASSDGRFVAKTFLDGDNESESEDAALSRSPKNVDGCGSDVDKTKPAPNLQTEYSRRDTEDYMKGYPGKPEFEDDRNNLLFYQNKIRSKPNGDYIEKMLEHWFRKYELLESNHSYIQWLFPIRERGMNWQAQELQLHEAETIKADAVAHERVLRSYRMMLDFYGMRLVDEKTGEIRRSEDNWNDRFKHLNKSHHNLLRITRILKSLGELGYENLKAPLVRFILREAMVHKTLEGCLTSCCQYWIYVIKDERERQCLEEYVERHGGLKKESNIVTKIVHEAFDTASRVISRFKQSKNKPPPAKLV